MRTDPIFIVEDPCSGSNYLTSLLVKHPDVGITVDSNFVMNLMYRFRNHILVDPSDIDAVLETIFPSKNSYAFPKNGFLDFGLQPAQLKSFLNASLPTTFPEIVSFILKHYCRKHFPGSSAWGIKNSRYVFELDKLIRYFPKAKFIHVVRDGRAVYAAKKRSLLQSSGEPIDTDPVQAAKQWNRVTKCFDAFQRLYPQNTLEISHEALVHQRQSTQAKLFQFLEVSELETSFVPETPAEAPVQDSFSPVTGSGLQPQTDAWKQELTPLEIYLYETVAGYNLKYQGYDLVAEDRFQRPTLQLAPVKPRAARQRSSKFLFLQTFQLVRNRCLNLGEREA